MFRRYFEAVKTEKWREREGASERERQKESDVKGETENRKAGVREEKRDKQQHNDNDDQKNNEKGLRTPSIHAYVYTKYNVVVLQRFMLTLLSTYKLHTHTHTMSASECE